MDPKGWPVAFGIIAAFVLMLSRGAAPPERPKNPEKSEDPVVEATRQEASEPASSAPEPECHRWCEPIRMYEEFFGLPASGSLGPVFAAAARLEYKLDVLIALIPDPLDAGLSNRSDEALDAIQRGFADDLHLFDRQGLLWQGEAARVRRARREPGGLLFRRFSADSRKLTMVLLVGETPKGGVHKGALREALALAERLRPSASNPSGPIRILGPTFSGSAESLRITLHDWLDPVGPPVAPVGPVRFKVVTGSATAPGVEGIAKVGGVVLERTVVTDNELEQEAYLYFQNQLGWDFRDVALLIELDTGYGRGAFQRAIGPGAGPVPGFLVQFPSHLSRLRTAREQKGLRDKSSKEEAARTSRKLLDLSLSEEDREPIDIVPQASSLSTAADDLSLSNQLQAICREGARYVGIVATDIQDRLFLAEHVRSYCPDVVLFTFDNHLLGSHPHLMKTTEGALIVSSFPLRITSPADEPRELRRRRQSTSELHEGIVLAVQRLLGGPPKQAQPWIVAVGQGQLWPVARLEGRAPGQDLAVAGTEEVTFKWIAVSLTMVLLASWLWRISRRVQLLEQQICLPAGGLPGLQLYPLAGLAALTLASAVMLVFYALPLWRPEAFLPVPGNRPALLTAWGLNLLALAALYIGSVVGCASVAQAAFSFHSGFRAVLGWSGGALFLLLAVRGLFFWWAPQDERFFYARAGDFASGLSPLVSLACLLAAVYAWAMLGLRSRRLSLIQGVCWPLSPGLGKEPLATCGMLAQQLDSLVRTWSPSRWFWGGLIVVLLLPLRRLWHVQPIAEHAAYGWIFLALVTAGFILAVVAFSRVVLLWRKLEQILELLCSTWLLDAFKRSSPFFDWKPLRSFGWRMPRHKMSLLSFEVLRSLAKRRVRGAEGEPMLPEDGLDREIGAVIRAEKSGALGDEILARQDLQRWFTGSTEILERKLPQVPARNREAAEEIEKYLALQVVGWIRYLFAHLRYSLTTALLCGLLVLVGVSAYAFQPKRFLSFGIWAFLIPASLVTLQIFVRMDRNTVLSAIGGSDPGKVSLDRTFFSNLFTYVGIPVLGVVLTQFPALAHLVGDWLQPLMRLLTAS